MDGQTNCTDLQLHAEKKHIELHAEKKHLVLFVRVDALSPSQQFSC